MKRLRLGTILIEKPNHHVRNLRIVESRRGIRTRRTLVQASANEFHHLELYAENLQGFGNNAILGQLRLSIVDLREENNHPLPILGRYTIVYDGETQNYLELRQDLERQGAKFHTEV